MKEINADIEINVELDQEQMPENIAWRSRQGTGADEWMNCKGMLISFFDKKTQDTFRIDLWTKDMQVMEMDRFMFHTMRSLADTYKRATNNTELAEEMQSFVDHFAKSTGLLSDGE